MLATDAEPGGMSTASEKPPVFILGSPRSFTSLVCAMLGQHPATYGLPEMNLFVEDTLTDMWERMSGVRQIQLHGILRVVAQLYGGEQSILAVEMAKRWVLLRLERTTAQVYRELRDKVAPLICVDKSPIYSESMANLERIHCAFPDAYYLHLVRHPMTQGNSIMKIADGAMAIFSNSIDYDSDPPVVDPQISWFQVQANILEFLQRIPEARWMRKRGEDVANDPKEHLAEICAWLGIDTGKEARESMMHPEDSPYATLGPLGAHLGNDINFLRSPAFRPGGVKMGSLHGPLPWRKDGKGFREEVLEMASKFGYA